MSSYDLWKTSLPLEKYTDEYTRIAELAEEINRELYKIAGPEGDYTSLDLETILRICDPR